MSVPIKLLVAVAPVIFTVLFGWLTMEGHLNFGGGEKDVFLLIPLLLWSLVYFCCFLALWRRRWALGRWLGWSAGIATVAIVVARLVLLGASAIA